MFIFLIYLEISLANDMKQVSRCFLQQLANYSNTIYLIIISLHWFKVLTIIWLIIHRGLFQGF